jgi:5'-3' exonuclease
MGLVALIDGDIVAYRCAASCEPTKTNPNSENERIAIARTDELMDRILSAVKTTEYQLFVSGSENFRKLLYPEYKRHRDDIPKPRHLDALRNFLVHEWGAEVAAGYEADDAIGIAHGRLENLDGGVKSPVICSIDKDFRQIPGLHYNFVKDEAAVVSPYEATFSFWCHMLIGDTSDNVRGVAGIGPIKSRRHLENLAPEEMESVVRELYADDERFALNRRLLRILRTEQEWIDIETELREGKGPQPPEEGA